MNRLKEEMQVNGEARADPVALAEKTVAEARAARAKRCNEELTQVLDRYGMVLVGVPFIDQEGRLRARVDLGLKQG